MPGTPNRDRRNDPAGDELRPDTHASPPVHARAETVVEQRRTLPALDPDALRRDIDELIDPSL